MKAFLALTLALVFSLPGVSQAADHTTDQTAKQTTEQTTEHLPTLTDYFRSAPLYMVGRIRFEKSHRLFHDQKAGLTYLEGTLQPNHDLEIWLSKNELRIKTKGGLRVSLAGIPVSVTSLKYNNQTGLVEVESSILGVDAGNYYAEQRMAEEIQNKFRVKLRRAFWHLLRVRQQKTLDDAANMLNEVINVFNERKPGSKAGRPLPTFTGEVNLVTHVPKAQTVRIGKIAADIAEDDALISSVLIRVPSSSKVQIRGLMFSSSKGMTLRQAKGSSNDVISATLKSFSATEDYGFQLEATNGGDDIISAGRLLIEVMKVAGHGGPVTETSIADAAPSTLIQQLLNLKIQGGLRGYVQTHRADLLKAGASPQLVNALEIDHPAVGAMPFIYPGPAQ